jgi:hypothetical protein
MKAYRFAFTALALAALTAAFLAGAASAEPKVYTFNGAITPTDCGPQHSFDVSTGNKSIEVAATTALATNDIVLKLFYNGKQVASADTLTAPEEIVYSPGGELAAGEYTTQICPYTPPIVPILPPFDYVAVVTVTPLEVPTAPPTIGEPSQLVQTPSRVAGKLAFAAATVIDAQRTEGEPLNFIAGSKDYWETGPWGTSTQNSFVHRSTDGGREFHVVSPIKLRPDPGPGGGDTDVVLDDQGTAYFTDLESLINLDAAVSNDGGQTWRRTVASQVDIGQDRQWYAIDNGTTPSVVDNTVFLGVRSVGKGIFIKSSPGSTGSSDAVGGLIFQNAASTPAPLGAENSCGQLRFDPVKRNLYYPCLEGDHVRVTTGHVAPGQRTGIAFANSVTPASPGGGDPGHLFPALAVDGKGNVFVAWADEEDQNVYLTLSIDEGKHWSKPIRVNSEPANTAEFVWAAASGDKVAVGWLGTDKKGVSDDFPQYNSNPDAADDYQWFGYIAMITNATSTKPTIAQQRFTKKPMHYGEICNSGIGCTAGGDRTMADYFGFSFDQNGLVRITYNDTTTPNHGAHLYELRQGSSTVNPKDGTNDAQWPHYSATGPGPNMANLDLTGVKVTQVDADSLRLQMTVAAFGRTAPSGSTNAVWLTRFQAKGAGDKAGEAYPIYYVGAESVAGGSPQFFAGHAACQESTPGTCKLVYYPKRRPAEGKVEGNTITIDVDLPTGFGRALPGPYGGLVLYSVTAFTFGRTSDLTDLYADVDATDAFDFTLKSLKKK